MVDEGMSLQLPPIALPRAWDEWLGSLGRVLPGIARILARRQSRLAREHWSASRSAVPSHAAGIWISA